MLIPKEVIAARLTCGARIAASGDLARLTGSPIGTASGARSSRLSGCADNSGVAAAGGAAESGTDNRDGAGLDVDTAALGVSAVARGAAVRGAAAVAARAARHRHTFMSHSPKPADVLRTSAAAAAHAAVAGIPSIPAVAADTSHGAIAATGTLVEVDNSRVQEDAAAVAWPAVASLPASAGAAAVTARIPVPTYFVPGLGGDRAVGGAPVAAITAVAGVAAIIAVAALRQVVRQTGRQQVHRARGDKDPTPCSIASGPSRAPISSQAPLTTWTSSPSGTIAAVNPILTEPPLAPSGHVAVHLAPDEVQLSGLVANIEAAANPEPARAAHATHPTATAPAARAGSVSTGSPGPTARTSLTTKRPVVDSRTSVQISLACPQEKATAAPIPSIAARPAKATAMARSAVTAGGAIAPERRVGTQGGLDQVEGTADHINPTPRAKASSTADTPVTCIRGYVAIAAPTTVTSRTTARGVRLDRGTEKVNRAGADKDSGTATLSSCTPRTAVGG